MCGLFAWLGRLTGGARARVLEAAMAVAHRGPDASRVDVARVAGCDCVVGFHRLAIMDTHMSAMQPLTIATMPDVTLVYNGELYNHEEVCAAALEHIAAAEGAAAGIRPTRRETKCDGEALLLAYAAWGAGGLAARMRGVFAFLLIDRKRGEVVVGRDPFGVRPLYVARGGGGAWQAFCSEPAPLALLRGDAAAEEGRPTSIDPFPPGTQQSFALSVEDAASASRGGAGGVIAAPRTPFVPLTLTKTERYWDVSTASIPSAPSADARPTPEALAAVREALVDAVQVRTMCEREVGDGTSGEVACLLSGGLDSSLIASLLQRALPYRLHTYAIGMSADAPDLVAAREVARFLGTEHHEVIRTEREMLEAVPEVVRALGTWDTTTVRASTPMYLLARAIREMGRHVVLFSGEGADELLQGYVYWKAAPSVEAADEESRRRLADLHYFDVLRADRSTAAHGLEMRVPFLDARFVRTCLALPARWRTTKAYDIEKGLLRAAFDTELAAMPEGTAPYIPARILWRHKEAFSDGVSTHARPWYVALQEHAVERHRSKHDGDGDALALTPADAEAALLRDLFATQCAGLKPSLVPYQWLPRWVGDTGGEPSARVLRDCYRADRPAGRPKGVLACDGGSVA